MHCKDTRLWVIFFEIGYSQEVRCFIQSWKFWFNFKVVKKIYTNFVVLKTTIFPENRGFIFHFASLLIVVIWFGKLPGISKRSQLFWKRLLFIIVFFIRCKFVSGVYFGKYICSFCKNQPILSARFYSCVVFWLADGVFDWNFCCFLIDWQIEIPEKVPLFSGRWDGMFESFEHGMKDTID